MVLNPSYQTMISGNRIASNLTGILIDGSSPVLYGNIVENNSGDGVYASNYSNPRFGDYTSNDPGNNIIRYNGETQIHSSYSEPFLGEVYYEPSGNCDAIDPEYTSGGFNSIYDPEGNSYLVFTGKGSTVSAVANWWGECPPDDNRFFSDGWPLYYLPALDYDPNEGLRPSILSSVDRKGGNESGQSDPHVRNNALREARLLRSQNNYSGAVQRYASIIAANADEHDVNTALQEMRHTYHDYARSSHDTTLLMTLESYLRNQSNTHPRQSLKRLAKTLRAAERAALGDHEFAMGEYDQLLRSSNSADERAMIVFALFNINAMRAANENIAQQYVTRMQNDFPEDIRTRIAAIRLEGMKRGTHVNLSNRSSLAKTEDHTEELPSQFSLEQNFPNPFNPTTTIKYGLPIDAYVTLKLYDVLGREVVTLVDEQAKAGYHSTTLDASKYSSGVYFYRIQTGQFSQTKKLILVR